MPLFASLYSAHETTALDLEAVARSWVFPIANSCDALRIRVPLSSKVTAAQSPQPLQKAQGQIQRFVKVVVRAVAETFRENLHVLRQHGVNF